MRGKMATWTLLASAGCLMLISGILMAICVNLYVGGILWAAASLMFFSAYHFKLAERNKMTKQEASGHEEKTV
ncbi:MAG: hypothetical protein ACI3V3_05925 [Faecousia sp.]